MVNWYHAIFFKIRFVKCEKCAHFFVVLSDSDTSKFRYGGNSNNGVRGPNESDGGNRIGQATHAGAASSSAHAHSHPERKMPPAPKKIFEYLNKHIIGQEEAKKALSVAVYNHYKRIYHNIPSKKKAAEAEAQQRNMTPMDHLHDQKELVTLGHIVR